MCGAPLGYLGYALGQERSMASVADPNGGGGRTRTSDTGLMRPLLCHLSYAAKMAWTRKTRLL